MIGRILCRLGWHSWKPVLANTRPWPTYDYLWVPMDFKKIGRQCRRCRKRVSI